MPQGPATAAEGHSRIEGRVLVVDGITSMDVRPQHIEPYFEGEDNKCVALVFLGTLESFYCNVNRTNAEPGANTRKENWEKYGSFLCVHQQHHSGTNFLVFERTNSVCVKTTPAEIAEALRDSHVDWSCAEVVKKIADSCHERMKSKIAAGKRLNDIQVVHDKKSEQITYSDIQGFISTCLCTCVQDPRLEGSSDAPSAPTGLFTDHITSMLDEHGVSYVTPESRWPRRNLPKSPEIYIETRLIRCKYYTIISRFMFPCKDPFVSVVSIQHLKNTVSGSTKFHFDPASLRHC